MQNYVLITALSMSLISALLLLETLTIGQKSPRVKFQRFLYAEIFFLSAILSFGAMMFQNNLVLFAALALWWFVLGTIWMIGAIWFE